MKLLKITLFTFIFTLSAQAFAMDFKSDSSIIKGENGGIDFTYSEPEIFFTEPGILKLSVIWEILNCFGWDNGTPINECVNLEFVVKNRTGEGDQFFISDLMGQNCLTDGCEGIAKLPLVALLSPLEYQKWEMGLVVIKQLFLHLGYLGEEDQFGRIFGREISDAFYKLKFILNGTGPGSVSVISLKRYNGYVPPVPFN